MKIPPVVVSRIFLAASLTYVSLNAASAATKDWNPPGGGSATWSSGANWDGGVAPVDDLLTDIARFNQTLYNFQPNAGTTSIAGIEIGDGSTATAALTLSGTNLSIGASGITKYANSGLATISSPISLGAAQTWTNNSSTGLIVSGAITGSNALSIAGTGSVTLSGTNSGFSGGITVKSGTLISGAGASAAIEAASLGTGTLVLGDISGSNNATWQLSTSKNPTIANAITVAAGSSGTLSIVSAASANVLSGAIALNNNLTFGNTSGNTFTVSGAITGASDLTINGTSGTIALSGNNSAFTGNVKVAAGTLQIAGQTGATKSLNVNNTVSIAAGATFNNNNNILTIAGLNDLNGGGGTLNNGANNSRDLTLGGAGTYSFSGNITNTGGVSSSLGLIVALTGSGSQTLSGNSTYLGTTSVTSGVLNIQSNNALGATSAGTSVASGGTLQLQNNITVGAEALTINGTGASGQTGALVNVSGNNSYGGLVTLGSAATISSNSGTLALTNTGTITGATRTLTLAGSGNGSIASVIGTTTGGLVKNGSGVWTLTGASTYTGATTVNAGTLVIGVGGSGSLTSAITVNAGTLAGSGSTTGNVVIGNGAGGHDAFLAAGNSAGIFTTTGSLTLASDATYSFELNGATAQGDRVVANGISINSSALFAFSLIGDTSGLAVSQTYTILENSGIGTITGTFSNLTAGGVFDAGNGITFNVSGSGGSYGNNLVLTVATVPEPSVGALIALGALATCAVRRLRR